MLNGKGKQSWLVGSNILAHITCCLTFRTHCAHTFHKPPGLPKFGVCSNWHAFPNAILAPIWTYPKFWELSASILQKLCRLILGTPQFQSSSSYILGLSMPRNLKAPTSWLGNPVLGFPNVGIWETRLSKVLEMWHGARNLRCRLPKKEQVINIFLAHETSICLSKGVL